MLKTSKKEIEAEFDKIGKMYDCYRFLYLNADDEPTKKKIEALAMEHLLAKVDSIVIPVRMNANLRLEELRKQISGFKQ